MISKKLTGSYYTPDYISNFVVQHVANNFDNVKHLSILEPSVGDGSFVKAFNNTVFPSSIDKYSITAIDKIEVELEKAKRISSINKKKNSKYNFIKEDFLTYTADPKYRYNLIIGNPPYIKKSILKKGQIKACSMIHATANLESVSIKNIWPAFLIKSCQLLKKDGIIAFILPSDLLQLNFSKELRTFLTSTFDRTEIFTFDELLFDCKGQDTILFIGFKKSTNPGQYYSHISNLNQLKDNTFRLSTNAALYSTNTKWSHHFLSSDELTFISNIASRLNTIDKYCDSKPGIVTAANKFFIVNNETAINYELDDFAKPIIQKGLFVNGGITFDNSDYATLLKEGKPSKVLTFNNDDASKFPKKVKDYIAIGVKQNLPSGHKCSKRGNWFVIPNISIPPEGFFFRRIHHYPKLLKNNARVLVTDSAYKIQMKAGFDINSLIYSFYNSLTLAFSELNGRFYGGGVLELTPMEFKKLPFPMTSISEGDFQLFAEKFKAKQTIQDVLLENDYNILNPAISLTIEDIEKIRSIYNKLISKRLKTKLKE